jgi:hypothetical protein
MFLMNSSAECLRGSSFVRRAILSISLTGYTTRLSRLLPVICDRSLLGTSPFYFRMLPEPFKSFIRRAADTLCVRSCRSERNLIPKVTRLLVSVLSRTLDGLKVGVASDTIATVVAKTSSPN